MERCININHPTVQDYATKLQLPVRVVAAKIAIWQDQNDSESFPSIDDLSQESLQLRLENTDRIIWGHPAIGKTTAQKYKSFFDFDTDFKPLVAKKLGLPASKQNSIALNEWRKTNSEEEFKQAMREVWTIAKEQSLKENKMLMVSDMLFLRENEADFDKIITISSEDFVKRASQRGDDVESLKGWKANIDKVLQTVSQDKIIITSKYLSDLIAEQPRLIKSPNEVDFSLKAIEAITSKMTKVLLWYKQIGDTDTFWNKLQQDLGIPKQQVALLRESEGNTIEDKLTSFVANYSYAIEINTAKTKEIDNNPTDDDTRYYEKNGKYYKSTPYENEAQPLEISKEQYESYTTLDKPTQHYSNLTVPGGTNYTENEIATPAITPSIKGHAQFATDNGIGWFRGDDAFIANTLNNQNNLDYIILENQLADKLITQQEFDNEVKRYGYKKPTVTKTRRILELQSDLFQKGRDIRNLTNEPIENYFGGPLTYEAWLKQKKGIDVGYENADRNSPLYKEYGEYAKKQISVISKADNKNNDFLQLLNKDNNWVTFFVKSIIQDTAKQTITEVQESDVEAKVRELENSGLLKIKCD